MSTIIEPRSRNSKRYLKFAAVFSTILAERAVGTAFVVVPPSTTIDDWLAPDDESVWTLHEAPALDKNLSVRKLVWINSKTGGEMDRWTH